MTQPTPGPVSAGLLALALLVALPPAIVAAEPAAADATRPAATGPASVPAPAPAFADVLMIDAHAHVFEDLPAFDDMLRRANARTVNVCVPGTDGLLGEMHRIAVALRRKDATLYPFVTTFDLRNWKDPGFADGAVGWLRTAFVDGAVGVKIWKEVGLELRRDDGRFLMPDDPLFDPVYAYIAKEGKPLFAHLAEPIDAWLPLDPDSPHFQYYSANPKWHLHGKAGYPSHAEITAARDRILEKHPTLIVVGAHLGSLEHDLDGLARRLDRYPNFNVDCAGRLRNLTYQPVGKVRDFLIKYQDRVVYGADLGWRPHRGGPATDALRREYVRRVERRYHDDFAYLAGAGEMKYTGRTVQALNLPRPVLEKLYNQNATRLFKLPAVPPPASQPAAAER